MSNEKPQPSGWEAILPHLLKAQVEVEAVEKASRNDYSGYFYASAEDMITASRRVLHNNGLMVTRNGWRIVESQREGRPDKVEAVYVLAHKNGSSVACVTEYPICTKKGTPEDKALNASLTTGLSYFIRDLLLIPRCDEEVDRRQDMQVRSGVRSTPKPKTGRSKRDQFLASVGQWINRDITESATAESCIKLLELNDLPTDGTCTPTQFAEMVKKVETYISDGIEPTAILV